MEPVFVNARDLNEAYFQLISQVSEKGIKYEITEGSNKGDYRIEAAVASGWIQYPHTRPLAPIMPEGISPTTTDEKIEQYFANYLMDPELAENEEYKYSTWINGIFRNKYLYNYVEFEIPKNEDEERLMFMESQLNWCIRHFKQKGYGNNHCFITVGDPQINFNYDAAYTNETERKTSPCLRGIDIKIKENKVILGIIYRSWDLYAGFPENMGGFALLNQYIANELSIDPGPLSFYSQGLHIYGYQERPVMAYLRKE